MGTHSVIAGLLMCCLLGSQAEGVLTQRVPGRGLQQAAVAAAPATGDTCANGLACAAPQRCDVTTIVTFDGGQESSYQCVCANGFVMPDCQPPPSPLTQNNPPAAAPAPANGEGVCGNGYVCPVDHRCDVSTVDVYGTEELVYQCVCANGYFTLDCQPPPSSLASNSPPAAAPAPATGEVCENGHVCPVHHRCDVSTVDVDGAEEAVYQCVCTNGYMTPDCQPPVAPITGSSPPAGAPAAPATGTAAVAAIAATNPATNPALTSTPIATEKTSGGIGVGVIVGITIGSVAFLSLFAAGGVYVFKRRQHQSEAVEFQEFHRAHAAMDKAPRGDPPV